MSLHDPDIRLLCVSSDQAHWASLNCNLVPPQPLQRPGGLERDHKEPSSALRQSTIHGSGQGRIPFVDNLNEPIHGTSITTIADESVLQRAHASFDVVGPLPRCSPGIASTSTSTSAASASTASRSIFTSRCRLCIADGSVNISQLLAKIGLRFE